LNKGDDLLLRKEEGCREGKERRKRGRQERGVEGK